MQHGNVVRGLGSIRLHRVVRLCVALLAAVAAFLLADPALAADGRLRVRIDAGELDGTIVGKRARAWLGIPYAAPPVGAWRWRAPQAPPSWSGVRSAARFGSACVQPAEASASGGQGYVGSEDCLTLNVYAPLGSAATPRPVMLWIHGGANLFGSGRDFDGSFLAAREGVVVITINYRLGPFGWFHHPALTATELGGVDTGSFALLDMLEALRWVQRNIKTFGGDASNVTVFGESAGGQNVYALVLSPTSRRLFHKAIVESGGFWNMRRPQAINRPDDPTPGTPASAKVIVDEWLAALPPAARPTTPAALAAHVRQLSTAAVIRPYRGRAHVDYDMPMVVYGDALLKDGGAQSILASGDYNRVPMIVGANHDEWNAYLYRDPAFVRRVEGHWQQVDPARFEAFRRYYSDWWNASAVDEPAARLAAPVYAYHFTWNEPPAGYPELREIVGAAHGTEVPFVAGDLGESPDNPMFDRSNLAGRRRLSNAMMDYWAEFARRGAPGSGGRANLPEWPPYAATHRKLVFAAEGIEARSVAFDAETLEAELFDDPRLTPAERCAIFVDNTMFPEYPRARLVARGCTVPGFTRPASVPSP